MCTPLAIATDSLILLVSFASGCQCVRGCSDFVCSFELYCIIGLTCMLHLPLRLQWILVIALLSTSLSGCVVIVLLHCIDLYSCLVLLHCIELYYCIVYLHIPLSLQWVPVSPTCLLVIVFLLQDGRFILYCYCVLLLAYCHWHWHLLLIICLLPQLLRAVAPAPTLITTF